MSRLRPLIYAFWIFIGCMLLWQFYDYDKGITDAATQHPKQEHFFFYPSNTAAPVAPAAPVRHADAYVRQVAFDTQNNVPYTGSMTCLVTLKNEGEAKATGVQVMVRPFRGGRTDDEDVGGTTYTILSDNDPLAQLGQWVTFPDLAPGQSTTVSVVFQKEGVAQPGPNPDPQILFETEKATAASTPAPLHGN